MIFQHRKKTIHFPPLFISNNQIPFVNTTKFLGLTFDSRLTRLPHIKKLKAKCLRSLNMLKYLSHPKTGCNRATLLHIYKSLIRPLLDCGSPIYRLAPTTYLKTSGYCAVLQYSISRRSFPIQPNVKSLR